MGYNEFSQYALDHIHLLEAEKHFPPPPSHSVYTYLTIINGSRSGSSFLLTESGKNLIGRGSNCQVVLTDSLCSRIHASVEFHDDAWWVRDADSSNGSYVNNQKVDEARLVPGCALRFGAVQFEFRQSRDRPSNIAAPHNPTRIIRTPDELLEDSGSQSSPQAPEHLKNLETLRKLSLELLRCASDPDAVVRAVLERLLNDTTASVAGFLWMSDDGQMKTKLVVPQERRDQVAMSESLTERVCCQGKAYWLANQPLPDNELPPSLKQHSDAICAPVMHENSPPGALHIYKNNNVFLPEDMELMVLAVEMASAALAESREQAKLQAEHQRLTAKSADFGELIGESEPMLRLKTKISRVAQATGCLLVRGESGVGKELVSRAVHRAGGRADRPLLSVNCAAIPPDLMESQLFGHKRGAFTSAEKDHIGWFQQADSGTLFLDEIGEMTLEGQAKLLRILEGHPFLPVGGDQEISVDVRVIAATNRDLWEFVQEKRFREDLYYRLSVFELHVPPLRERGQDIQLLLDHFLTQFRTAHGRPHLKLSEEAQEKLLNYSWPGNVRQLRNVIDSAVVMADDEILPRDLGLRQRESENVLESLRLDVWEKRLLGEALARTSGNVPQAAKLLGVSRATVYRKMQDHELNQE